MPPSYPDPQSNLGHAVANDCTDNDCEIHNPDIAWREEVITETDLAFFVAGVSRALQHVTAVTGLDVSEQFPAIVQRFAPHLEVALNEVVDSEHGDSEIERDTLGPFQQ